MSKRLNNEKNYPFYWLDELAEVTLNPDKSETSSIKAEELKSIRDRLPGEISRISAHLKNQTFCLYSTDHIKVVAGHYDQAIRLLRQQAQINLAQYPESGGLQQTGQQLLAGLNELHQAVHQRYSSYLEKPAEPPSSPVTRQPSVQRTVLNCFVSLVSTRSG